MSISFIDSQIDRSDSVSDNSVALGTESVASIHSAHSISENAIIVDLHTRKQTELQLIESMVAEHGAPLLLLNCDTVRHQYRSLQNALPGVTLHFALKPLPHPAVVATLLQEGASFDLATSGEVDLVREVGVPAEKTIHTHPIKRDRDIKDALDYGCCVFVVDSENELEKFIPYRDEAEVLIRLSFRNAAAFADLSKKFGCSPEAALDLIKKAKEWGIHVKGLSFHVGSQTMDAGKYVEAITRSGALIRQVSESGLPALSTLDIGGGFPVDYQENGHCIDEFCAPIREALGELPDTVKVIAEPGRFIVAPAMISVSSVMGQSVRDGKTWYYLDDGVYGSYSGVIFDHGAYPIDALHWEGERFPSVLAGPTCDSIDVIAEDIQLPALKNGDLIIARMMGAYSSATATEFNFFRKAKIVVFNDPRESEELFALQIG
ncbi:ornithine decarboxylase/arginine decarboxylase [Oleiphilus messinensis]|uniref:Ornithine decarboxylase/arginine decarboxylase n=1 Tax=Oleiphilus messinensis TaxID=141451 RepID=A0A1Y0IAS4_9GAMM|nr:type III PLP-dependent enzyme [Oleiphilus messinensis]ARU56856.1 ornithine decarboxylase/arginine decarboxylase [Oleiphilus messinensis]